MAAGTRGSAMSSARAAVDQSIEPRTSSATARAAPQANHSSCWRWRPSARRKRSTTAPTQPAAPAMKANRPASATDARLDPSSMRSVANSFGPRSRQAMGAVATTKASAPSAASTNGTRTQRRWSRPSGNQATSRVTMAAKPGNHTHESSDATTVPAGSDPGLVSTAYRPYSATRPDTASDTPMTRHSLPTGWHGSRRSTTAPRTENDTAALAAVAPKPAASR